MTALGARTDDWDDPAAQAWGCAVLLEPTWSWDDTAFAAECAQAEEVGCRSGLLVRGAAAPGPRMRSDASFGGAAAEHLLAEGERITVDTVSCEPITGDGVRCEDASSGHGFELSPTTISAW